MLDFNTARIIKAAIKKETGIDLYTNDVCRMQPIPRHESGGHSILAIQCGDLTILVWVYVDEAQGLRVVKVKTCAW